jgi:CBS domain-containing protein
MTVATILKEKGNAVLTVRGGNTLAEAANILSVNKVGALVAVDERGQVKGILSERDVVRAVAAEGGTALSKPVSAYMTAAVVTCRLTDSINYLMERMTGSRFRHMPVVEDGILIGIVSIGDVVKRRIADTEHEAQALKAYIATG